MASSLDSAMSRPSSGLPSPIQKMPSRSRTQSISSDRPSTVAHSLMSPPLAVSPEAAFIAASAASQIITNDHDSHAETWYDEHGIEPSGDAAAVSPGALQLVNNFLDQLLFNFLSVSRSTALSALRPAVSEVLKPKLAKDAINQADEELREYLGGDDEDGAQTQLRDPVSPSDWDLELAWKRTRLRCMVYSSLGDMEEEDEDYYMEQGHLEAGLDDRFSEAVSPAVAIFLTSIMEFMGEQTLIVAGQAAYHRMRLKYEKELKEGSRSPTRIADRIVVEELDMERVALDRTLGRLWRSWKKKIRSPALGSMDRLARSFSRDSVHSAVGHLPSTSSAAELAVPATVPEPDAETEDGDNKHRDRGETPTEPLDEFLVAAKIPLPLGPNDIAEIEVPGLALCSDDETKGDEPQRESRPARPKSLMVSSRSAVTNLLGSTSSHTYAPDITTRKRSNSLPAPAPNPYVSPATSEVGEESAAQSAGPSDTAAEPGIASGERESDTAHADEEEDAKEDDDDEVSIEEPRIVRSSRVSILGRSSPSASSDHSKPAAINTNLPVRTPSIHSARLIEVTGPRSPGIGSGRNPVAAAESTRHSSASGNSRTATPPVSEDRSRQSPDGVPGGKLSFVQAAAGAPISETEEAAGDQDTMLPADPPTPASQREADLPAVPEPTSKERCEPVEASLGGGSVGSIPEPSTPAKPVTRLSMLPASSPPALTASTASGNFYIESMPVLPEGREMQDQPRAAGHRYRPPPGPQAPALPERNAGRQAVANTSAHRQPATIGQVSVERSSSRSPSEPSSSRPHEPAAGQSRQHHPSGSPSSTKLKAFRASEDGMQARIDVVRNFEELIQSDQTIQYTLTPESMRDIDLQSQSTRPAAASSPVVPAKARKSEEGRQNGTGSRSSPAARPNDNKTPTSAARSSGSGSQAVLPTGTGKYGGVVPRSIPPVPPKHRMSHGPQARDARLPRESLAEFAEFIRSTGPNGGRTASSNVSRPEEARSPGHVSKTSIEPGRSSTTSNPNRPRLQARDAAVDYKDDNSDLIDFIRRGPPSTADNPRIPRVVAPFRTTMDSDQMSGAVGGRAVDAQLRDIDFRSSQASTSAATEYSVPPSLQSSANSHSALLSRNKPVSYDIADSDMPIPKRKTRRVRDPYAIDVSDEELDDVDEMVQAPRKRAQTKEESLLDFLNNYPPPPEQPVQPFNIAQTQDKRKPKKKASAPSLMARLTRRDSVHSGNGGSIGPSPGDSRSLNSRASGGRGSHVPIQVSVSGGVDPYPSQYQNFSSPKAAATMGGGPGPTGGRVLMKKFEPRDAVAVSSRGTSDLAEFLKQSGPPPGAMANQFAGPAERDGTNGISRVFARRKKASIS